MAPMAALIANASTIILFVGMPERLAERGSVAVAVICLPTRVRLKRAHEDHEGSSDHDDQMLCTAKVSCQKWSCDRRGKPGCRAVAAPLDEDQALEQELTPTVTRIIETSETS